MKKTIRSFTIGTVLLSAPPSSYAAVQQTTIDSRDAKRNDKKKYYNHDSLLIGTTVITYNLTELACRKRNCRVLTFFFSY